MLSRRVQPVTGGAQVHVLDAERVEKKVVATGLVELPRESLREVISSFALRSNRGERLPARGVENTLL
jgi:hypothetical protein